MDSRRVITALLAAIVTFYLWLALARLIWGPPQAPVDQEPQTTTAPAEGGRDMPTSQPATSPGTATQAVIGAAGNLAKVAGGPEIAAIRLGGAEPDSAYPMELRIEPFAASVSHADIRGYYETVEREKPYPIIDEVLGSEADAGPMVAPSFATRIRFESLKLDVPLDAVFWNVIEQGDERVVLGVDVSTPDDRPVARVFKTYELARQPKTKPKDQTYDLKLSVEIENLTDQPLQAVVTQQGAVGFRSEQSRGEDRKVMVGLRQDGEIASERSDRAHVFKKGGELLLGSDDDDAQVVWVAVGNKYFVSAMAPVAREAGRQPISFASASAINLVSVEDVSFLDRQDLTCEFVTKPIAVSPQGRQAVAFDCYLGPKSKKAFQNVEAYQALNYYELISGDFIWCAPAALVSLMMVLLDAFHAIPPYNYGISIIVLVLVVRALLHPVTKKSQVNMMKMQKNQARLQPKLVAIKQKYANDRAKQNQAIMQLYKDEGVNPAGQMLSCLPMFLQIPIWGALWTALAYTIEMRHAPFDGWWIRDLTQPDALVDFTAGGGKGIRIPLLSMLMGGPMTSLNLLPILLGISQALQARFMPRGNPAAQAGGNPDQLGQQRKMMTFMSIFFVFILYNAPSGLTLYIMASNVFGILEQWRIRKHLAEVEEKGGNGTPPAGPKVTSKAGEPRKKPWLQRKWEELEKQAADAKRIQGPGPKKPQR